MHLSNLHDICLTREYIYIMIYDDMITGFRLMTLFHMLCLSFPRVGTGETGPASASVPGHLKIKHPRFLIINWSKLKTLMDLR